MCPFWFGLVSFVIRLTVTQPTINRIIHAIPTYHTPYSINYVTKQERYSPLTVLCSRPDVTQAEVKKALFLGANRFHKDEDGCTALHWAAMKGVVAAVAVLTAVSSGASSLADVEKLLKTKDGDGKTPLALAKESVEPDHEEVQALLVSVSVCGGWVPNHDVGMFGCSHTPNNIGPD